MARQKLINIKFINLHWKKPQYFKLSRYFTRHLDVTAQAYWKSKRSQSTSAIMEYTKLFRQVYSEF